MFLKTCSAVSCTGISFINSTLIRICKNNRIKAKKAFK
ncbi:hypothetical protein FFJ24_021095 [Pedobacter sp. KBS0701]|nr:hypothetical protein FFJ24_021095 [Pedobacter sp. KBS0701]